MAPKLIIIVFSLHAVKRLQQRVFTGHGLEKGVFIRLLLARSGKQPKRDLWFLLTPTAFLLGTLWMNGKGRHTFMVRTAFNLAEVKHRQRSKRQIIPIEARLFQVKSITAERHCEKATMSTEQSKQRPFAYAVDKSTVVFHVAPTLAAALDAARARYDFVSDFIDITALFADGTEQQIPPDLLVTADKSAWISPEEGKALEDRLYGPLPQTVREQVTDLLRKNAAADYWEKQVLRLSESLLAIVDEELRGIPVEEAGLEKLSFDEYSNMPDTLELLDGIPKPKTVDAISRGAPPIGFPHLERRDRDTGNPR